MLNWKERSRENYPNHQKGLPPNLLIQEIDEKDFKQASFAPNYKIPLPYCNIDTETWGSARNPAFFTYKIVYLESERELRMTKPTRTKWFKCKKHIKQKSTTRLEKCPDCEKRQVPNKRSGKVYTVPKKGIEPKVVMITGWCFPEDLESKWLPLLDKYGGNKRKIPVYAHNLSFDLIPIMKTLKPNDEVYSLFAIKSAEEVGNMKILQSGSKVLKADYDIAEHIHKIEPNKKWPRFNYQTRKIEKSSERLVEFKDSFKLLTCPLADLGTALGFPKGKTPQKFIDPKNPAFGKRNMLEPKDVEYGIRDVDVLFYAMASAWDVFKCVGYEGKAWPLTIGTLGSQIIAQQNQKVPKADRIFRKKKKSWKYETIVENEDLDDICRKAMVGGRTQVLQNHEVFGDTYAIDAKSMYPSQQTDPNKVFPDYRKQTGVKTMQEVRDLWRAGETEGAIYVEWTRPKSDKLGYLSGRNEDGRLDWMLESDKRWITMLEYRYATTLGYKLVPMLSDDGYMAILMPPLTYNPFGVVRKMFDARTAKKKAGDAGEFFLKILMNAGGFGKFVERNKESFLMTEKAFIHNEKGLVGFARQKHYDGKDKLGWAFATEWRRGSTTANIMGAYITAHARHNLYEIGQKIGPEYLIYCDTDSWKHTNGKVICPDQGNDLGDWVHENTYAYWHSLRPKQYKYHSVMQDGKPEDVWGMKIKGVNLRSAGELWIKDNPGKTRQDFIKQFGLSDDYHFTVFIGLKAGMRSKTHQPGDWSTITKSVGL